MFKMEERTDLVRFEHDGKLYAMTNDEIEAAYRYKEREFRTEDAVRQLNILVFGYDDPAFGDNPEDAGPGESEDLADFEEIYGVTYSEALELAGCFVERFDHDFTCDQDENTAWENAIRAVIKETVSAR